jgi:hypothetical protein
MRFPRKRNAPASTLSATPEGCGISHLSLLLCFATLLFNVYLIQSSRTQQPFPPDSQHQHGRTARAHASDAPTEGPPKGVSSLMGNFFDAAKKGVAHLFSRSSGKGGGALRPQKSRSDKCVQKTDLKIFDPPFGLSYFNDGVHCYETLLEGGLPFVTFPLHSYCFSYTAPGGARVFGGGNTSSVFALFSALDFSTAKPRLCTLGGCNCPGNDPCSAGQVPGTTATPCHEVPTGRQELEENA